MIKEKILKFIEDTYKDISPDTVKIYKEKFKYAKDEDVIEYFKHAKFRIYVDDKDIDSKKIDNLVEKLNIVTQETMVLPYKGNATTRSKVMIFPVQMRRLQQLATKSSRSNIDVTRRNKAGQAVGDSKTGRISDPEVAQLSALGLDRTLTELMSPRSDNMSGKKYMNEEIYNNLSFSLSKTPAEVKDKSTLLYIDALYKSMGIATDLIDYIDDIS